MSRRCVVVSLVIAACGGVESRDPLLPPDAAIDAPASDAPIDAAELDAAEIDAAVDAPEVDAIDAVPIDAPIDAAIDAPIPVDAPAIDAPPPIDAAIDAPPPFASPRLDPTYGMTGTGFTCRASLRRGAMESIHLHADGRVSYCWGSYSGAELRNCPAAGAELGAADVSFANVPSCKWLPPPVNVITYAGFAMSPNQTPTSFVDAMARAAHVDLITPGGAIRRVVPVPFPPTFGPAFADDPAFVAPTWASFTRVWPCGDGQRALVRTSASTIARIDAETWTRDASYGTAGAIAVPALVAVTPDCRVVAIAPGSAAGTSRITAFDANGQGAAPFTVTIGPAQSAVVDPAGRLLVGLASRADVDIAVARVDLAAGALDPAFGLAGVAELDVAGLEWLTVAFPPHEKRVSSMLVGARPGAVFVTTNDYERYGAPPMGDSYSRVGMVRLLVDD